MVDTLDLSSQEFLMIQLLVSIVPALANCSGWAGIYFEQVLTRCPISSLIGRMNKILVVWRALSVRVSMSPPWVQVGWNSKLTDSPY